MTKNAATVALQELKNFMEKDSPNYSSMLESSPPKGWKAFVEYIKPKVTMTSYGNWIEPIKILKESEDEVHLEVPNIFVKEYLFSNFSAELRNFMPLYENKINIKFQITQDLPKKPKKEKNYFSYNDFLRKIPSLYADFTLEKCNKIPNHQSLLETGKCWAAAPESLFIFGEKGCGKTTVAISLLKEAILAETIEEFDFIPSTQLDSMLLEAIKSDHGDYKILRKLSEVELLIIDDFGRENKSDRLRRQLFEIINQRYSWKKTTIITSNLTLQEVGTQVCDAIASRMQEWHQIRITGTDLRKTK